MKIAALPARRNALLRPLAASFALAGACSAWADDPNPYYIGVTQAFTHDSNVYRLPDAKGDNYSSTGLVGGIDQPIGRQRLYASGNVQYNKFQDIGSLDNTSYGAKAALDWSTIERLSGTVNGSIDKSLASYGSTNQLALTKKNTLTTSQAQARAQLGLVSLWSLEGKASYQRLNYSADEYDIYDLNQTSESLGVKYRPSGLLTLGAAYRHTHGRYPSIDASSNRGYDYDRNDIDLTTTWVATGQSTINARLSFGKQRYNDLSDRDFSGTTGSVSWDYRPTGKLSFNTTLTRDTGTEVSFLGTLVNTGTNTAAGTLNGDNSRISTSLIVAAGYAATGKINVNAGLRYIHRSLQNAVASSTGEALPSLDGEDNIRSATLGLSYAATRSLLFGCNLGHDGRSVSNGTPLALSYAYHANTASCSAQFTLQ